MARLPRRLGLRHGAVRQYAFQRGAPLFGFGYWSFSAWAKLKVKNAVNFIGSFERELAGEAQAARRRRRRSAATSIIPTIRDIDGVTYVNTGDFVESCSLVVEHDDGRLEVLYWRSPGQARARRAAGPPAASEFSSAGSRSRLMRILVATDAWRPQVNGVVPYSGAHDGGGARNWAPNSIS